MPLNQTPILPEQKRLRIVNAQPRDLQIVFQRFLGECAENTNINWLARYRYTEEYSRYAVSVGNAPDDVSIEGDGLELIINPTPTSMGNDRRCFKKRWRVLVKDHSTSQTLIHPAFQVVQTYMFPFSECMPYVFNEELQIQQAIWRIDLPEVPQVRSGKRSIL